MSSKSNETSLFPSSPYITPHKAFPYPPSAFQKSDSSPDTIFYSSPRLVTHIDDAAIARLTRYYDSVLPRQGRILDFCASWKSFFPEGLNGKGNGKELEIYGVGLNATELSLNTIFTGWKVVDLNSSPEEICSVLPLSSSSQDSTSSKEVTPSLAAATCTVSIDYLTSPIPLLTTLHKHMLPGASIHLAISNRCFPTKVVRAWLERDEQGRLELVGDYLHFAGFQDVQIVNLSERDGGKEGRGWFYESLAGGGGDPLWVVTGRKMEKDGD